MRKGECAEGQRELGGLLNAWMEAVGATDEDGERLVTLVLVGF